MRAPDFWYRAAGPHTALLTPAAWAVAAAGRLRRRLTTPVRLPVPVVCVGNLTVGGSGKTPVVRDLAARLRARGLPTATLSRGYGGRLTGPVRVDPARHRAIDVGDEPLLLAADGDAWVAHDRAAGGQAALDAGAAAIVMDDGHQNPRLDKDLSILVIDPAVGFGNGRVIPAGPLREGVRDGLARAQAVAFLRARPEAAGRVSIPAFAGPVLTGYTALEPPPTGAWAGRRVHVLAGIARPGKVSESLAAAGAEIIGLSAYPDHHPYTETEAMAALEHAIAQNAALVTTAKDVPRLPPAIADSAIVARIRVAWDAPETVDRLLARLPEPGGTGR